MICMLLDRSAGLLYSSSLLLYFKASSDTTKLPDPRGPLSTTMPSSSMESANAEVKRVIKTEESESSDRRKGGHRTYLSWDVTDDYSLSYHCYSERISTSLMQDSSSTAAHRISLYTQTIVSIIRDSPAIFSTGRTKFTYGAHDVIAITSPQKNDLCTEDLLDRTNTGKGQSTT